MDSGTLEFFQWVAEHGGNVLLVGAVWIAARGSKTAQDAVAMLKEIRDGVVASNTEGEKHRATLDSKLDDIHNDLRTLPLDLFRARKAAEGK